MRRALLVALLVALPLAAAAEDPPRKQEKPDPDTLGARIKDATARASRALAAQESKAKPEYRSDVYEPGYKMLVALALVRAGGPDEKAVARALLDAWWERASKHALGHSANYELSLAISALEGLSLERAQEAKPGTITRYEARPIDPLTKSRLEIATRALCEGRVLTEGGAGCAWCYDVAPFTSATTGEGTGSAETPANGAKPGKTTDDPALPPPGKGGVPMPKPAKGSPLTAAKIPFDLSNTQFAILALHDAARGGVPIPKDVLREMTHHLLATASDEKGVGWGYADGYRAFVYPAMTFAGLSSLAIARELGQKDPILDKAIASSLAAIGERIKKAGKYEWTMGRHGWGVPYDLYSLEKALDLLDVSEVSGKDWFAPLAEQLLKAQGEDGFWEGDPIDTSFYVLFLLRATPPRTRVSDHRTVTGKGAAAASLGEVFLPKRKATVDAIELVSQLASSQQGVAQARECALEAISALSDEGHGRDACLIGPLGELLAQPGSKHEAASSWLRDLSGKDLDGKQAASAAKVFQDLVLAREKKDAAPLRSALADPSLPLPVKAFAASALAALPCPASVPAIADAALGLAEDKPLLATAAGARGARACSEALVALVRSTLAPLPQKGAVSPEELAGLARAAKEIFEKGRDDAVSRALAAYAARERNRDACAKAKDEVAALGDDGRRLLLAAASGERAKAAFAVLRAVTGELIPDDADAWRAFLDAEKGK